MAVGQQWFSGQVDLTKKVLVLLLGLITATLKVRGLTLWKGVILGLQPNFDVNLCVLIYQFVNTAKVRYDEN